MVAAREIGEVGGGRERSGEVGGGQERLEKLVAGKTKSDGVKLVAAKAKRD